MSIRQGMLALLAAQPMYGAQLRSEFETRTAGTWPLNVGQVYQTLARLQRDGLVEERGEDAEGRTVYALTETGRAESAAWWASPVERESTPRSEIAIKLALAVTLPDVDVRAVVQAQRSATMGALRELTRAKAGASPMPDPAELARLLVVDHQVYAVESELRWLDAVEDRLIRRRG